MKYKILIVDDVYPNRFLMEQVLSDYQCLVASNGTQMWESLKTTVPDLILMDIGLPDEDGLSLAARISADERYRDVAVVFVTAHSSRREIIEGMRAGGYDYLVKPVDETLLIQRIEAAIKKARTRKLARECPTGESAPGE
jgi:DNA-binding response OmpR family regulator